MTKLSHCLTFLPINNQHCRRRFIRTFPSTGLFIASVSFDTPLISVIYGRILKPFGVVIVTTVRFCLVYNNACQVARYLWKYCINSGPIFELSKFSGNGRKSNIYKVTPSPPYDQRGVSTSFHRSFFIFKFIFSHLKSWFFWYFNEGRCQISRKFHLLQNWPETY